MRGKERKTKERDRYSQVPDLITWPRFVYTGRRYNPDTRTLNFAYLEMLEGGGYGREHLLVENVNYDASIGCIVDQMGVIIDQYPPTSSRVHSWIETSEIAEAEYLKLTEPTRGSYLDTEQRDLYALADTEELAGVTLAELQDILDEADSNAARAQILATVLAYLGWGER